jgi:2'-5' RNA ligase
MGGYFGSTVEAFGGQLGLPGLANHSVSRVAAQRLRRRHAGLRPAGISATDRLFFAVLPDSETAAGIHEKAERWRREHGLTGRLLRPEHFHVTLHVAEEMAGVSLSGMIELLAERASTLAMPAFRIDFDRVLSFRNGAFVLSGEETTIGLQVLHQRLGDALDPTPRPARRFTPHLTLLRDGKHVAEHDVDRIGWTAREVVLVHSLLGQTTHRHVARIPLN